MGHDLVTKNMALLGVIVFCSAYYNNYLAKPEYAALLAASNGERAAVSGVLDVSGTGWPQGQLAGKRARGPRPTVDDDRPTTGD